MIRMTSPPPHVLAIPHPAQGHVLPMMELSRCLANHGCRVTFVNTDINHKRIMNALAETSSSGSSTSTSMLGDHIRLVSLPDGTEALQGDNKKFGDLTKAMSTVMPHTLEELIKQINSTDDHGRRITCMIADMGLWWAIQVAVKMGIKTAGFCVAPAAMMLMCKTIPKLIQEGVIDTDGTPLINTYQFLPNMPAINTRHFIWACVGNLEVQKIFFRQVVSSSQIIKSVDKLICNTSYDLEAAALTMAPEIIPIGPLVTTTQLGSFLAEDPTCITWLDQQPPLSVIYISFGSIAVLDQIQFHELAMGLELSNKRFLWVVRPGENKEKANNTYPSGFEDRVVASGKIVSWAPQQMILGHPAMACFITHCGWNSTIEAISSGVPLLCWPYFADQFFNQGYICDVWKVGLALDKDERGIITRDEIKNKVDQLLGDDKFKVAADNYKAMAMGSVSAGGRSYDNLKNLIDWIKM